jgi:hypothetical protein
MYPRKCSALFSFPFSFSFPLLFPFPYFFLFLFLFLFLSFPIPFLSFYFLSLFFSFFLKLFFFFFFFSFPFSFTFSLFFSFSFPLLFPYPFPFSFTFMFTFTFSILFTQKRSTWDKKKASNGRSVEVRTTTSTLAPNLGGSRKQRVTRMYETLFVSNAYDRAQFLNGTLKNGPQTLRFGTSLMMVAIIQAIEEICLLDCHPHCSCRLQYSPCFGFCHL